MTIQLEIHGPDRLDGAAGERELRVTLSDPHTARRVATIVENVRGEAAEFAGDGVTVRVRGVDGKAAVDVLAELSWAGLPPESFALL